MAIRESDPNPDFELYSSVGYSGFSDPGLIDRCSILIIDVSHSYPADLCFEQFAQFTIGAAGSRYASCFINIAQTWRAILFASAIATRILGLRLSI